MPMAETLNFTDRSGTITLGGTAQTIMPADLNRRSMYVYNESDTNMRVSIAGTGASATVGFLLKPDCYWEPPAAPIGPVTIYCATTGKAFSAGEAG